MPTKRLSRRTVLRGALAVALAHPPDDVQRPRLPPLHQLAQLGAELAPVGSPLRHLREELLVRLLVGRDSHGGPEGSTG